VHLDQYETSRFNAILRNVARYAPRFVHCQHLGYVSVGFCLSAMLLAEDADPFLPRVRVLTRSVQGSARPP
jgi:hypothetical protein